MQLHLNPGAGGSLSDEQLTSTDEGVNDGSAVGAGVILCEDVGNRRPIGLCSCCCDGGALGSDGTPRRDVTQRHIVCNRLRGGPCHHGDLQVDLCDIGPILGTATRKATNVYPCMNAWLLTLV